MRSRSQYEHAASWSKTSILSSASEERIATRLFVHQLRERRGGVRRAVNSVRNQLPDMCSGERPRRDLVYRSAGGLDRIELAHERMRGSDFVVAVGTDEEKITEIGPAQQVFH